MTNKPNYYAIVPANVRYNKNLCPNSKLLYGEITALCNEKGYCWASNDYFAKLYEVSKTSISKWIKQLIDEKHIESKIVYKEGTKHILHRYLTLVIEGTQEKLNTPIEEKLKENNTLINNTLNNTLNNENSELQEIIDFWNDKEIIIHTTKTTERNIKKKHLTIIKDIGKFGMLRAIQNYKEVLESDNYYWNHKWNLWDFIQRGADNFVDAADPLNNYRNKKISKKKEINHEENTRLVNAIKEASRQ